MKEELEGFIRLEDATRFVDRTEQTIRKVFKDNHLPIRKFNRKTYVKEDCLYVYFKKVNSVLETNDLLKKINDLEELIGKQLSKKDDQILFYQQHIQVLTELSSIKNGGVNA